MGYVPYLPLWGTVIGLILILINAWFSAGRKSISESNKIKIRELAEAGDAKAIKALSVIDDSSKHKLSVRTLNVIIYMLYCLNCMYTMAMDLYATLYTYCMDSFALAMDISYVVIFLVSMIILLALGETVPRRIAVQHAEGVLMKTAGSIKALTVILKPVTACISAVAFVFLKLLRQRTDVNDNEYSEEDIVEMLEAGQESGELKEEGKKMITGIFAFDDILAYEIMTPRTDVFAIDINDPAEEYIDELMELRYSRIPVYEDDSDNILGILYIKDYLIKAREEGFDNVDIKSILRTPYFVPDTKNIDSLFYELQKTKQHIAILIDEYGGFCGIVTMEDIIEEVMGEIDDEYDEEDVEIKKVHDNKYIVEGSTDLDDLNEELGISLESEDSETVGGFIIDMFGEIPDEDDIGKELYYKDYVFTIKSVKDRRVEEVILETGRQMPEKEE